MRQDRPIARAGYCSWLMHHSHLVRSFPPTLQQWNGCAHLSRIQFRESWWWWSFRQTFVGAFVRIRFRWKKQDLSGWGKTGRISSGLLTQSKCWNGSCCFEPCQPSICWRSDGFWKHNWQSVFCSKYHTSDASRKKKFNYYSISNSPTSKFPLYIAIDQ